MTALHELQDKGLIEGRYGYYNKNGGGASKWYVARPWPLCYCSMPKVPKPKPMEKAKSNGDYECFKNPRAKKFVPVDGELEEDTGLVDRIPTSVGKGQRRLGA